MRGLWSERAKRALWRSIWVSLSRVQARHGLVRAEQVEELELHAHEVDVPQALRLEAEIHHDLMAELKTFAAQCPKAGGIIHLGATSMDIEDNADALRQKEAFALLLPRIRALLLSFAALIEREAATPVMAFTHLQPAEPTTLGYRLAMWAQDILEDYRDLERVAASLRGKGFKGAVGTAASYAELVGTEHLETFEEELSRELGIGFWPVATQTYPRRQDYVVISVLAGLGASLHKFAFDLRILQSPPIGELSEPFGSKQVGSSAMPFKRNPINAEKIDSLARALSVLPQVAWQNAAQNLLERTLDDSANRRSILPEAFLACDELVGAATRIVDGLVVDHRAIGATMAAYAPFACTERILMAMGKAGADRQETHERLRLHALDAWAAMRSLGSNPLFQRIAQDSFFVDRLGEEALAGLMDVQDYAGSAPARAKALAAQIRSLVEGQVKEC